MWEHKAMFWVNVISFMTIAKVLPSLNHFHLGYKCSTALSGDFLYQISPKADNKYGKCG
jgi:hypothetical protein